MFTIFGVYDLCVAQSFVEIYSSAGVVSSSENSSSWAIFLYFCLYSCVLICFNPFWISWMQPYCD